ncbi:MAG: glutathione S-transferase family protein [Myxococcales bacterium]|nr:glutathione S-transferase family protein [Myxococcales bacterium]
MSTPTLAFYFAPGSSSMAPHIALHEVGAAFEARPVSFASQEHRSEAFLALNPEGKVPTLLVDGRPLTEVAAILWYLARRFPEADLLPSGDVESESRTISWMSFIASTVHPVLRYPDRVFEVFKLADAKLGSSAWAVGRYSIADIHLFRLFWRFWHSDHPPPEEFPNLVGHYRRMAVRPSVRRTCQIEAQIGYELRRLRLRDDP